MNYDCLTELIPDATAAFGRIYSPFETKKKALK